MSNRNQHFVSQAYLRRFGIDAGTGQPRSINLFALNAGKIVHGASIRNQCSRNYFYGEDKVFDDLLQSFEGRYGGAVAKVHRGEYSQGDIGDLVQFLFLQYLRTPFQVDQRLRLIDEWGGLEMGGKRVRDAVPPPDRVHEAQHQLYIFAKEAEIFDDLKPVLLINRTKFPFITSDNPAICMNRLYTQRYGDITAGMIQSGILACLPIGPRICLLVYDGDVYQPIGRDFTLDVRNESDVGRLNELQVIRASGILFFQDTKDDDYVRHLFDKYKSGRRDEWSISWTGIRDGEDGEFERYRKVRPEDNDSLEPRIQSTSPIMAAPSSWPSFLKYRMRPTGYTNGSAVGFVREAHAKRRGGRFRQVVLPDRIPPNEVASQREEIYQRKDVGAPRAAR